nr:hypothetical protein [Kibdelosporangium sp. MJ126-NF4]CEL14413.1 hypothetical protein [Kibdelosporangium sp. MJ126-NF4]CTQ88778.1 hypothetical protein [Kibdelosporangium sp. MJ126-NF4]
MRLKVAVTAGTLLVLALLAALILLPDEQKRPAASLTVPSVNDLPDSPASRTNTNTPTFIVPGASVPATTTPTTAPTAAPPTTAPPANPVAPPAATATGKVSFYGARTNDPPGSRTIAYTDVLHKQAGGTGTFTDPITFAAGTDRFKPGTKIYVPDLKRYFILEDLCPDCSGTAIVLWTGAATDSGSVTCQKALAGTDLRQYEIGPPADRPLVPGDLYQNGQCFQP